MNAKGEKPEVLFWVGCAGSFDDRAKKITKALVKILNNAGVSFAVLGTEESCSGDPAKRAGNEFLQIKPGGEKEGNISVRQVGGEREKFLNPTDKALATLMQAMQQLVGKVEEL